MLAFGFGQIGEAVKNAGFNTFILFYDNQVLHVSVTSTSIALAIALVFNAFTDPIAGGC
jgi:GPH family glycoside/pentoside/hexuronide:cation symporter